MGRTPLRLRSISKNFIQKISREEQYGANRRTTTWSIFRLQPNDLANANRGLSTWLDRSNLWYQKDQPFKSVDSHDPGILLVVGGACILVAQCTARFFTGLSVCRGLLVSGHILLEPFDKTKTMDRISSQFRILDGINYYIVCDAWLSACWNLYRACISAHSAIWSHALPGSHLHLWNALVDGTKGAQSSIDYSILLHPVWDSVGVDRNSGRYWDGLGRIAGSGFDLDSRFEGSKFSHF